jgi:hypothetical protein
MQKNQFFLNKTELEMEVLVNKGPIFMSTAEVI